MAPRWAALCLLWLCGAASSSTPQHGGGSARARTLRADSREITVPARLVYRADRGGVQTAHDILGTRVRAISGAEQVVDHRLGRDGLLSYMEVGPGVRGHQKNHLAQTSFQVKAFGQTFILDVELNQMESSSEGDTQAELSSVVTKLQRVPQRTEEALELQAHLNIMRTILELSFEDTRATKHSYTHLTQLHFTEISHGCSTEL
ncbi:hypothetical protein MHYP_G00287330 [Metynnis hypsauchen]